MASSDSNRLQQLLSVLDQAFSQRSWHGTTLRGSLRGVDPKRAQWRPAPDRHSIWEYALHTAYWKYVVRRRLTGDRRGGFSRRPSDWPAVPDPATAAAWKDDVALVVATHAELRAVVADFDPGRLDEARGEFTVAGLITGVAAHDLYHAGQIQLLKRLAPT